MTGENPITYEHVKNNQNMRGMLAKSGIYPESLPARELNIPCIIGAEIAARVLKDGDLVEVDANQGMVKILKRKLK